MMMCGVGSTGGFDLPPVFGHLGDSEPIVKPTLMMVGFCVSDKMINKMLSTTRKILISVFW
jgi:hypothetical protein